MKKLISIILLLVIILCACGQKEDELRSFTFTMESIEGTGAIRMINAEGQKKVLFMSSTKAVEIAKKYCTFGNAESFVSYDCEAGIYRVV